MHEDEKLEQVHQVPQILEPQVKEGLQDKYARCHTCRSHRYRFAELLQLGDLLGAPLLLNRRRYANLFTGKLGVVEGVYEDERVPESDDKAVRVKHALRDVLRIRELHLDLESAASDVSQRVVLNADGFTTLCEKVRLNFQADQLLNSVVVRRCISCLLCCTIRAIE